MTVSRVSAAARASSTSPDRSGDASSTATTSASPSAPAPPRTESRHSVTYSRTPWTGTTTLISGRAGSAINNSASRARPAGWRPGGGGRVGRGRRLVNPHPARPPVPPAEEHHSRRHKQRSDKECVHENAERESEANVADLGVPASGDECEHSEGPGQDEPGRSDRGAGGGQRPGHGLPQRQRMRFLADPGHHQDVVILAKREQEDEHQERQEEHQPALAADVDEQQHRKAERGEV